MRVMAIAGLDPGIDAAIDENTGASRAWRVWMESSSRAPKGRVDPGVVGRASRPLDRHASLAMTATAPSERRHALDLKSQAQAADFAAA